MLHVAVFSVTVLLATRARAETMDNPAYASWSKCKPGTTTVLKVKNDKLDITITTKLIEVTGDKCVVSIHTDLVGGLHAPDHDQEIARQLTNPDEIAKYKKQTRHAADDTITTPAGTFKCKRYDYADAEGGAEGHVWFSDDVPGQRVKSDLKMSDRTTTTELQSIDRSKRLAVTRSCTQGRVLPIEHTAVSTTPCQPARHPATAAP